MNILFQGDSITDAGRERTHLLDNYNLGSGYVTMVAAALTTKRDDIVVHNRGISGNRTEQIAARWEEDALAMDYDILSLLCGINDIGFDLRMGVPGTRDLVEPMYDKMIYQAKEKNSNAKIILMTPFVFKRYRNDPTFGSDIFDNYDLWHERTVIAGEMVKDIAKKYNTELIPLFDIFKEEMKTRPAEEFSPDCVHPTALGHAVIAREWLKVFERITK